jgi:hypothetical protein
LPLVNISLSIDQERLIRRALGSPTGFLTYRVLTGGYTGALVLEVSGVGNGNARKKFVLKIDKKDKQWETISDEFRNFQEHVESLNLSDGKVLTAQKFELGNLEAIKYPFASIDSVGNSESFGQYFKKTGSFSEVKQVISSIFSNSLIINWSKTYSIKTVNLFEAFGKLDYKIRGFKRITEYQSEYNYDKDFDIKKIEDYFNISNNIVYCTAHGDLHVENIRVDPSGIAKEVFFIDFGRTGQYPMGIDYTALECSIRYSILDSAFPLKKLSIVDDKYFDENFSEIFNLSEDKLSKVNYAISLVRQAYINNFPKNHRVLAENQYFLCMFAVSSWLINKENLNRPYIWNTLHRIYNNKFKLHEVSR